MPTRAKQIVAKVKTEALNDRAIEDEQRGYGMRGCLGAVEVERPIEQGFESRDHHRHVLGPTAGHHGIGGNDLHRGHSPSGRHSANQGLRRSPTARHHRLHPCQCGGNHRQSICPALLIEPVDLGLQIIRCQMVR